MFADVTIRAADPMDAERIAYLHRTVYPYLLNSAERVFAASALVERIDRHATAIGAKHLHVFATGTSAGFARKRGFERTREVHHVGADLRSLPPMPPMPPVSSLPPDLMLLPVSELEPRALYEADVAASLDEPSDVPADAID